NSSGNSPSITGAWSMQVTRRPKWHIDPSLSCLTRQRARLSSPPEWAASSIQDMSSDTRGVKVKMGLQTDEEGRDFATSKPLPGCSLRNAALLAYGERNGTVLGGELKAQGYRGSMRRVTSRVWPHGA